MSSSVTRVKSDHCFAQVNEFEKLLKSQTLQPNEQAQVPSFLHFYVWDVNVCLSAMLSAG